MTALHFNNSAFRCVVIVAAYCVVAIVALSPCTAQTTVDPRSVSAHPAEQLVAEAVESELVPGAVLMITRGEDIVSLRAFGFANEFAFDGTVLDDRDVMTTGHAFDLASLTKVFATTFGIMILADRGEIDLDSALYLYLPEFRGASRDSITIRHLLTHTAGLSPWKPIYYHATTPAEAFTYIRTLPLAYAVGKERHYSDLGFMLLGYLIERVSGSSLDRFMEEALYEPLGLTNTEFTPEKAGHIPFAATSHGNPFERRMVEDPNFGYHVNEDPNAFREWRNHVLLGEVNDGNSWHAHGGVAGHAGLFSTASDLNTLLTLLLGLGRYNGQQLISSAIVEEFLTPDATGNGLGWAMSEAVLPVDIVPAGAFGHTGFTGTFAYADPNTNLKLILLTNRQHGGVNADGNYPALSPLQHAVARTLQNASH